MDGLEITYRLKRRGWSQVAIAKALGVSPSVVGNVIHGRISSYQVASHVASLLGAGVTELWPQRYVFKPRGRPAHHDAVGAPLKVGGSHDLN